MAQKSIDDLESDFDTLKGAADRALALLSATKTELDQLKATPNMDPVLAGRIDALAQKVEGETASINSALPDAAKPAATA